MLDYHKFATLEDALGNYSSWMISFGLLPDFGFLIMPDHQIKCFQRAPLDGILDQLATLIQNQGLIQAVENMASLNLKVSKHFDTNQDRCHYWKDLLYLHEGLASVIRPYLKLLQNKGESIMLPKNLAQPFVISSRELDIKTGVTTIFPLQWSIKNNLPDLDNLTIKDLKLRFQFTTHEFLDLYFFGASIVTSYFLTRILQLIYETNCYIQYEPKENEKINGKLRKIKWYWQKICDENFKIISEFPSEAFYYQLRPKLSEFRDVKFEGYEEKFSGTGGNGGYDPQFQIFERAFGITFKEQFFTDFQTNFKKQGMITRHCELIEELQQKSLIRSYCELEPTAKQLYNQILQQFHKFTIIHSTFIKNYILKFTPQKEHSSTKGVSGYSVNKIMSKVGEIQGNYLQ